MEQIYYTQCPIGYGLGASNGFQIKRLTENYPISGDFRHFNLRAYPGGTRTLAPRTLRYRRDGDTAEVAYLTPRTQEYETERGLWGRPGGHFAHGLRLSPEELAPLANWAGGLFSSRFWKTTDPEPSRGRPPDDLLVTPHALAAPPTLANARPFLADLPADFLAQLLAAVALATHQQQTLFLIDAPERLADRVAGLTLAFPPTLRRTLTFSTFHDRPEELTGYRIQGTSPIARPNRAILSHQGFLAEISERSITPAMPTLPWATSLAEAILAARPEDDAWAQDVEAVAQRAIGHRDPGEPEAWSNQWLDQLLAFPSSVKEPAIPRSEEDWESTLRALAWAKAGRLTRPWSARRGVAWFRNAIDETAPTPLIKECLARHLECRELWETAGSPSGWGGIAGDVLATYAGENPVGDVDRLMKRVPDTARPGFVQAMLHRMPPDSSERILSHLRRDARLDRALLLPLEAVHSLQALWSHQDPGPLRDVVAEASARPGLLSAVLDALDREVGSQEIALEVAAAAVAEALSLATAQEWLPWMLRKEGRTVAWFRPWIRPTMAEGGGTMTWEQVRDLTPADLRADLARTFLEVAADPKLPELAFQWGVENLVVSLNPEDQPVSSGWPLLYLQKLESDLDLIDRLMVKKTRVRGLGKWLKSAHERGHLDDAARRRMADVRRFLDVVEFGTVEDLSGLTLPQVPPRDRGRLLSRLANSFLGSQFEGLGPILDACLRAWPDGVYPGADGLEGIGTVIAGWLEPWAVHPSAWTDQLEGILARMGIPAESGLSWEPDGLAAFVLSATNARGGSRSTWPLREFLLSDPARRRVLALEVLRELAGVKPLEAPGVYERWDSRLPHNPAEPFYEVFLNACDGPRMAAVVASNPLGFRTLRRMSWWKSRSYPDARDDLRDAFARLAPIRPFPSGTIGLIDGWLQGRSSGPVPVVREPSLGSASAELEPIPLSPLGQIRWAAIQELTLLYQMPVEQREAKFEALRQTNLLGSLTADEAYGFAAWLILALPFGSEILAQKVGAWLFRQGIVDPNRVAQWRLELDGQFEVEDATVQDRADFVATVRKEIYQKISESRRR